MKTEVPTAFPWNHGDLTCTGMTLRDYFAAKAMYSLKIQDAILHNEDCDFSTIHEIAEWSYYQADAMLKARGK